MQTVLFLQIQRKRMRERERDYAIFNICGVPPKNFAFFINDDDESPDNVNTKHRIVTVLYISSVFVLFVIDL